MKRTATLLLALALAAAGCVELPKWTDAKTPAAKESESFVPSEAPPVRPDQVNDDNARQALDALRSELDRAAGEPPIVGTPGPKMDR